LDWEIILYDKKHIYRWDMDNHDSFILDKKFIYKYVDYDGWIMDITNDYIIVHSSDSIFKIIPLHEDNTYDIYTQYIEALDSERILLIKEDKHYVYTFRTGEMKELEASIPYRSVTVSENTIFNGKDCYDLSGNILFSLPEKVEYARNGFTDGYMLVKSKDTYRYIDKAGNTLPGSEFVIKDKQGEEIFTRYYPKPFGDGFGLIIRNGKWGLIDRFGTTTFDYQ
jgi:hypothetical protein